jgi:hypothetical protein
MVNYFILFNEEIILDSVEIVIISKRVVTYCYGSLRINIG